ncbi:MAG: periplasmic heavy metal sensor [Verrucomicrobia bacterium]|nr:periplasmic heavy metal sensor [Verrucomicrobiota bacterium]
MNPSRWKIVLALVAIFVAGAVTGAYLPHTLRRWGGGPPRPSEEEMARHLQHRFRRTLSLTPEQEAKVNPLLEESARNLRNLRAESEKKVVETMEALHRQIRTLLTPEQQLKLEEMEKRRRERFRGGPR